MNESSMKSLQAIIDTGCASICDSSQFSAYPQLQYPFFNIANTLRAGIQEIMDRDRAEAIFGKTPWAKLYQIQTGKRHDIPEEIIESVSLTDRPNYYGAVPPLRDIYDYARKYRDNHYVTHFETSGITGDFGTVWFSQDPFEARVEFHDSDVQLIIPIEKPEGHVHGPLFHEPYRVVVKTSWMTDVIWGPLFKRLVGDEDIEVSDNGKFVIHDQLFKEEDKFSDEELDNHPGIQLYKLLAGCDYRQTPTAGGNGVAKVMLNDDYLVALVGHREWSKRFSDVIGINAVYRLGDMVEGGNNRAATPIHGWARNPLLVRDIMASAERLVKTALENHHANMKETNPNEW